MHTEMALSTMKAEFIALSEGIQTAIPVMSLIED